MPANESPLSKPVYVRISDCRSVFGFSKRQAYRLASEGKVRIRKFGGLSLLHVQEVEAMIESSSEIAG